MSYTIIGVSICSFIATLLGGLFALRFKDRLHLILGFSAGAVLGVALFDLLPESMELASQSFSLSFIASLIALGFVVYMLLDRFAIASCSFEEDAPCANHQHIHRGMLGAGSLVAHSFFDGAAIGLAFHVSSSVGMVVTFAVLAHDFSDGINTVNMIVKNNGKRNIAFRWLIADALAPVAGVLSTSFFFISQQALGFILALFCGFFLYIGASELLPESHHAHPTRWTTCMTVLGMAVLYGIIHIAR